MKSDRARMRKLESDLRALPRHAPPDGLLAHVLSISGSTNRIEEKESRNMNARRMAMAGVALLVLLVGGVMLIPKAWR